MTKCPFWPCYDQIWPNMGLISILGDDNFTSHFYVKKKAAIPEIAVILTSIKTNGHFLAILWQNLVKCGFDYNFGRKQSYKPISGKGGCRLPKAVVRYVCSLWPGSIEARLKIFIQKYKPSDPESPLLVSRLQTLKCDILI